MLADNDSPRRPARLHTLAKTTPPTATLSQQRRLLEFILLFNCHAYTALHRLPQPSWEQNRARIMLMNQIELRLQHLILHLAKKWKRYHCYTP